MTRRGFSVPRWSGRPIENRQHAILPYLFVEVERYFDGVRFAVDVVLEPRGLEIVEDAILFHHVEKMLREVDVERLPFSDAPHLPNYGLALDVQADDVQLRKDEPLAGHSADGDIYGLGRIVHLPLDGRSHVQIALALEIRFHRDLLGLDLVEVDRRAGFQIN